MRFNDYIIIIGTGIIVIAFLAIIYFSKKYTVPYYLKYFYWFPIIGLIVSSNSILWTFFHLYNGRIFHLVQDILTLLWFIILFVFFIRVLKPYKHIKVFIIYGYIITGIQFVLIIYVYINQIRLPVQSIFSIIIIPLCLVYYRRLLKLKPIDNLFQSPPFWIITGIFFYTCVAFIVYNLSIFLPHSSLPNSIRSFVYSFGNISAIVLYFLIIKAYTCLKHPQNS